MNGRIPRFSVPSLSKNTTLSLLKQPVRPSASGTNLQTRKWFLEPKREPKKGIQKKRDGHMERRGVREGVT